MKNSQKKKKNILVTNESINFPMIKKEEKEIEDFFLVAGERKKNSISNITHAIN